ncbi:MAG: RNA polymerase factor sigma-54 [Parachlamydiaceae bacterium]|nr:RNA polymerase factor sigma-54 [Parachlamydiaceae bacterium]
MNSKQDVSRPGLDLQMQSKQSLAQRLIMSAHMQQAIRLLQVPLLEIEAFVEEQVSQNPILEVTDSDATIRDSKEISHEKKEKESSVSEEKELVIDEKDFTILKHLDEEYKDFFEESGNFQGKKSPDEERYKSYLESSIQAETNLYAQLIQEAHESFQDPLDLEAAELIIGYVDECGFIDTSMNEIAILHNLDLERVNHVLKEIQSFEPFGVGASSIKESLLIQLRCLKKEQTLAYRIIQDHYEDLLNNRIPIIHKALKCTVEDIQYAIDHDIAPLDLHPGTQFSLRKNQPLIPDVSLREEAGELIVEINRDYTPNLRLNKQYLKMLEDPNATTETKSFIRHHVFSARWLMKNLQQRYSTIERIAESLAKRQREFFLQPDGKLVPLTMKTLAEELNVHESTIARTVSYKYIDCPRGLIPLRSFFTTEYIADNGDLLSSKTVQQAILDVIKNEDKNHPYSDEKISSLLKEKGIPCARRTVAKYRGVLSVGNTLQRKKF